MDIVTDQAFGGNAFTLVSMNNLPTSIKKCQINWISTRLSALKAAFWQCQSFISFVKQKFKA